MNYTQLYKRANMRKAATAAQIYKVATLLKKAEQKETVDPSKQSAGLGTWSENAHDFYDSQDSKYKIHSPSNRNYFSQLIRMNPQKMQLPVFITGINQLNSDISRAMVDSLRAQNAKHAVRRAFSLPSSFRNNALFELAKKIGKWKEQQWKEKGAIPTKMSPELDAEYNETVKGVPLPEGRTQQQAKDRFYRNISDAIKHGRHSNVG